MTKHSPSGLDDATLPARLVRRRTRKTALARVHARWPLVERRTREAWREGRERYGELQTTPEEHEEYLVIFLARLWKRRLGQDRDHSLPAVLAEFSPTFLADLVLFTAARRDPFATASRFYRAYPELAAEAAAAEKKSRRVLTAPELDSPSFQAKIFGAVLYHYLRPLRLAPPPDRPLAARSVQEAGRAFLEKLRRLSLGGSLLCATAMAYGDGEAIALFRRERSREIRGNFRKLGVREPLAGQLVDDMVGTVCLRGCTYFAYGTLSGWLWWLQRDHLAGLKPQPGLQGLEGPAVPGSELGDRDFRGRLEEALQATLGALPRREWELLRRLCQGTSLVELAQEARVVPSTVMRRRDRLLERLRRGILEALFPRCHGPEERERRIDEVLPHIPHLKLDLAGLFPAPGAGGGPEGVESGEKEERKRPGEGCHVPDL